MNDGGITTSKLLWVIHCFVHWNKNIQIYYHLGVHKCECGRIYIEDLRGKRSDAQNRI